MKNKFKYPFLVSLLSLAIIVMVIVSISYGQADVTFQNIVDIFLNKWFHITLFQDGTAIKPAAESIIWFVRAPRVILALLVGMGLALVGVVMQAMVQNPLADPYILGISSGASLGATFAILIGFSTIPGFANFGISFGAFWGALIASILVFLFSSIGGRMTSIKLILSGTIISAMFSALTSLIVFLSNNAEGMKTVTFWSMGSLASAEWEKNTILAVILGCFTLFFFTQHRLLDVMLLGEDAALSLGVNLRHYRMFYMGITAVLTGVIVSFSGMIGFVGLIVPHIVRGFVGSSHKRLVPISVLAGGLFMVVCDLISRTIVDKAELPIGIITALIGAPIFIYMIVKKEYNFGGA